MTDTSPRAPDQGALRSRSDAEVVSLGERMGYMQALRAALGATVLASGAFASNIVGARLEDLMLVTAGYLLLSALVEGGRRVGRARGLALVGGMLLMDGVYLAWVMYQTGGTQSPLRFLVYIHLIAVTLLASYRTGLKIALWHSLLFFVVFYAQGARILAPLEPGSVAGVHFERPSFFNVVAFWLVALVTTAFSSVNERELRRRKVDLEALARMAEALEEVTEPPDVGRILLDSVQSTFDVKRGVVVAAQDGATPALLSYRGPDEHPSAEPGLDASVHRAWDERSVVLLKKLDPDTDPQLNALLPFATGLVVVPLFAEGHAVGAMAAEYSSKRGGRIERRVVDMLTQFASHAALALRNSWLLQQVQQMADTDALTGIANRRTFGTVLERELSRAARSGEQVTLVMLDVDHFKKLNDEHGHQVGDEVLRQVAESLAGNCRDFDTPARYGGEEFAMILPACSSAESLVAGERIRKGISESRMTVDGVTASAGVATFPVHAADAAGLIKAADEALYESKRSGRNRVTRSRRGAGSVQSRDSVTDTPSA